jgi:hypothetical protein
MSPPPTCAEPCPQAPEVTCRLEPGNHLDHFGGYGDEARSWPNLNYVAPRPEDVLTGTAKTKAQLTAMARRLRQAQ